MPLFTGALTHSLYCGTVGIPALFFGIVNNLARHNRKAMGEGRRTEGSQQYRVMEGTKANNLFRDESSEIVGFVQSGTG